MRLVERHIIKQKNKWFREIDKMSFLSENLFNRAVYLCRQALYTAYFIQIRYNHNQTFVVWASCPQNVYLIPSQTAVLT
jgi:hypothetical protein